MRTRRGLFYTCLCAVGVIAFWLGTVQVLKIEKYWDIKNSCVPDALIAQTALQGKYPSHIFIFTGFRHPDFKPFGHAMLVIHIKDQNKIIFWDQRGAYIYNFHGNFDDVNHVDAVLPYLTFNPFFLN